VDIKSTTLPSILLLQEENVPFELELICKCRWWQRLLIYPLII